MYLKRFSDFQVFSGFDQKDPRMTQNDTKTDKNY